MRHAREDYDRIQDPACLIYEEEPVFLIRGQDIVAPKILRAYAEEARKVGASPELVRSVIFHAARMETWQKHHKVKVPDL